MPNKKVLIISPYFPPSNAADMQRVRMSLPYFERFGWDAEIVTADQSCSDVQKDGLLLQTVPAGIEIHLVKAYSKTWTSKIGIGNIAFRSYRFYKRKVNELLASKKFDLIYFSTTQFPICVLGAYWKDRFSIPFVIDMQDPWHSEYYRDKPKHQRPPKYWLIYRMHKFLEPLAMNKVDGLISVSEKYITDLKDRYERIQYIPASTITFGGFEPDMAIAEKHQHEFPEILDRSFKNIVYVGRGGMDMHRAIKPLFQAYKKCLEDNGDLYGKLRFYFIGTSYAANGSGRATISPLAQQFGLDINVVEITDRLSYFHTLATLQSADALFIPGSDDPKYTASKIYPYLLTHKPMLALFNAGSPALQVLRECGAKHAYAYDADIQTEIADFLKQTALGILEPVEYDSPCIEKYSAENLTKKQCELFDQVLQAHK